MNWWPLQATKKQQLKTIGTYSPSAQVSNYDHRLWELWSLRRRIRFEPESEFDSVFDGFQLRSRIMSVRPKVGQCSWSWEILVSHEWHTIGVDLWGHWVQTYWWYMRVWFTKAAIQKTSKECVQAWQPSADRNWRLRWFELVFGLTQWLTIPHSHGSMIGCWTYGWNW